MPEHAVVIVYDVTGPAGMSGSLELLAAEGGLRRENWTITLPLADGPREIRGSAVHAPDAVWRAEGEDVGVVTPARLGSIADAIVALPAGERERVIAAVRTWRAELAAASAQDPGARETIAGIDCVRVRAGGGEVCTWEVAGLPLRYDGPAFSVVATHVELGASLGEHAFDIPPTAAHVPMAAARREWGTALAAIASGDRAEIMRLLYVDALPSIGDDRQG
jgi:hypothetical protein